MGFYATKLPKYPHAWRVVWRKYEKDAKSGEYTAKLRHIPETEYRQIGITKAMTLDEVKAILKKVNLDSRRTDRENRRNAVAIRQAADKDIECSHLPKAFVDKFEREHLATRYMGNPERLTKVLKLWRASQKIIRTIPVTMDQWCRYPQHFYAHFQKNAVSPGYAKNILSTINMWLDYLGTEQDKHYRPVPAPDDGWQSKINDAFDDAGNSKASLPITPEMLKSLSEPMPSTGQYNWIYCSVWAGLRPNEVNALLDKKRTVVEFQDGTPVLAVYQSKLKNVVDRKKRWKRIPLFLPEQLKILDILESKDLEEPLCKTLANRFGEGHSLYGGRKGFHDLMVTRYRQPELEVVRWLGHRSLDMAMKHYAKEESVRWTPVVKKAS